MSVIIKGKFKLVKDVKKLPNGLKKSFEMIDHPGAVLIVPFLNSRKIVLLRQYRPALGQYLYEFPCGTIDVNEKPLACARREIIEEAGYRAGRMKKLGKIYPAPGYTNEVIYVYAATQLIEDYAPCDDDEIIKVVIKSNSQMKTMIQERKIVDAKTICALVYCGWL